MFPRVYWPGVYNTPLYWPFSTGTFQVIVPPQPPVLGLTTRNGLDTVTVLSEVPGTNPIGGYVLFVGYPTGAEVAFAGSGTLPLAFPAQPTAPDGVKKIYYAQAFDNASPPNYSLPSDQVFSFTPDTCYKTEPKKRGFTWSPLTDCPNVSV